MNKIPGTILLVAPHDVRTSLPVALLILIVILFKNWVNARRFFFSLENSECGMLRVRDIFCKLKKLWKIDCCFKRYFYF